MLLKKIFKAKWQHNNPEVRKSAIDQLRWCEKKDKQILQAIIVGDPESELVDLALSKISSVGDLIALNDLAPNTAKSHIETRLLNLLDTADNDDTDFVEQMLDSGNRQTLTDLTTFLKEHKKHLSLLCALLARNSPGLLATLAIEHPLNQIRQIAVEFTEEPELLAKIASALKSRDKGVYQKVKSKLQARRQIEQDRLRQKQQLEEIYQSLELHAVTEVAKFYSEKLDALIRQYKAVVTNSSSQASDILLSNDSVTTQIKHAIEKCRLRAAEFAEQLEADYRQQQQIEDLTIERQGTISELERTISQLKSSSANDSAEIAALDGLIKTQENRWLEATKAQQIEKNEQKAYQVAMGQLRQYYQARRNLLAHSSEINELLTSARGDLEANNPPDKGLLKKLRQCINTIGWPDGFKLPELLQNSAEIAGQIQTIQTQFSEDLGKQSKKIEAKIKKLAKEISGGELKHALRLSKEINSELNRLPSKPKQELTKLFRTEQVRLEELKDWKGFATLPKQEKLCERMEHLARQHLEPRLKAQRIKSLQDEWRALGGSPDQKLWQRFKKYSDSAFEPCKEFFEEEKKLKKANLEKRAAICVQLEEFISQINWQAPDWKAIDKINKKAREEWRLYYPVDHKEGKLLQQQFNKLLANLDEHLSDEKTRNHRLKIEIVEAAKELIESEDVKYATDQAKRLQKKWQSIGITDHKKDRQLWSAFRKSCDVIFKKLEVCYQQNEVQQQQAVTQAETLIQEIQSVSENIDSDTDKRLKLLTEEYQSLNNLGTAKKALDNKLEHALKQIASVKQQQKKQAFKDYHTRLVNYIFSRQQDDLSRQHLSREHQAALESDIEVKDENEIVSLLIQMEIIAGLESPASDKNLRMAVQVARLTEGLNGGSQEQASKAEKFNSLLIRWLRSSQSSELKEPHRLRLLNVVNLLAETI